MSTSTRSVASNYLQALLDRGIDYVFANAGTDTAPIIEALVAAKNAGVKTPQFLTVPHENVAISMAHGYFLATGKPAAVMVHVTVGTANALCGLMNAARDQAPILLTAGRTPSTETGHIGSRNASIHWGQDSFDQGGIVREWVKWDYELRPGQPPEEIVGRALDVAMSEPKGPVYLCMPREVLGDLTDKTCPAPRPRALGALPATPSQAGIKQAAQWLAEAKFPLIISSSSGRDPANVARIARIAETFGIGVAMPGEPGARELNIPTTHPMFLGIHPAEAIAKADAVLVIDCEVPWWPSKVSPLPHARLIHVAPDPLFNRYPVRGFQMDLAITGSSSQALDMLEQALSLACAANAGAIAERQQQFKTISAERSRKLQQLVQSMQNRTPLHPAWIAHCINEVIDDDTIIVNEMGVPMDFLALKAPRSYLSSSLAGGLGFGLGAAVGAKLGARHKKVILIVGDGSYMFGCPTAAHHVARMYGLPTTTLVMNNARWNAVHRSTLGMYPEGV
ncbi:MAG TPA: thiamine pyrophosphate-requiring protein, partial [Candidatus Acidoferrum sp.]|nr:thiamine pyrophosphate-requiring protein [Candidatus Acidoferrum sp.]